MSLEKPRLPFRTVTEAIDSCTRPYADQFLKATRGHAFPCTTCSGEGRVVDPKYVPDYEGRTEYVTCPTCKGARTGTKKDFMQKYFYPEREKYRVKIDAYSKTMRLHKRAKKKLSPAELKALLAVER